MAKRARAKTAVPKAPKEQYDGDINKKQRKIWFAHRPHDYSERHVTVGRAFPRFLALLSHELRCRRSDEDARRVLGVGASSLSGYEAAAPDHKMARSSLLAVCLKSQMWAKDLEFADVAWAEEVDTSLSAIGFESKPKETLKSRLGVKRWAELRNRAELKHDGDADAAVMAKIRQMIVTRDIPRDCSINRLWLIEQLDEKPSRISAALDKLVIEGTLNAYEDSDGRRQYTVTSLTPEAVDELLQVRLLIEKMLIEELAHDEERRKIVVSLMQPRLRDLNSAMENDDLARFVENDIEFHASLAMGRLQIEAILRQTLDVVTTAIPTNKERKRTFSRISGEHEEILRLIKQGTKESMDLAVTTNHEHVMYAFREVSATGLRSGESGPSTIRTRASKRAAS